MTVLAGLVLVTTSCATAGPAASAPPASGATDEISPGTLTVLMPELGSERFDFAYRKSTGGNVTYFELVHGFLLTLGNNGDPIPAIAKSWSVSPDGLTVTFTVTGGVKFHDGSALTAQDVYWTLDQEFGAKAQGFTVVGPAKSASKDFKGLELVGTDTVRYTSTQRQNVIAILALVAGGYSQNRVGILPKRDTVGDEAAAKAYDRAPVGAGPMRLVRHTSGSSMEFERFADYYYQPKNGFSEDRRVRFQKLVLTVVPEPAARVAAIQAGQADLAPVSARDKSAVESAGGRLIFAPETNFPDIRLEGCWGAPAVPCKDKRVRQALDYAIDKVLLRDRLFGGADAYQVNGWNFVTPHSKGYSAGMDPRPYDPDKARQLLAEAGYAGGKGFGKLIINTYASGAVPNLVESAQAAASMWRKDLGLDVEVRVGDADALSAEEAAGKMRGQIFWRDQATIADPIFSAIDVYAPSSIRGNRALQDDAELYKAIVTAAVEADPAKQAELRKQLYLALRDLDYQIGIGYSNTAWAVGPRVKAWKPGPINPAPSALHTLVLSR